MANASISLDRIDVCLVATRRPALLERTLRSFHDNLLRHFGVRRFIANVDPLFGNEADEAECVALIRSFDPQAVIRLPERAGFTTAVTSNWLASSTDVVLHLEDDWLLNRPVHPDHLQPFADYPWIGQISFNHDNKAWDIRKKGSFCYAQRHVKLFNRKFRYGVKRQNFLTGPSFLRGDFARRSAALMDPAFDPEKQFCRGLNRKLERYVADFRNMIIGEIGAYYIEDLGRQWREEHRITKEIVAGQSYWMDQASNSNAARRPAAS